MKHSAAIESALANFHESWMNDEDRGEMNRELLKSAGITMEQLDDEIETGVRNGYPVQEQLELLKRMIAEMTK